MDEMEEDPPPFWLQSNTARHHAKHHRRCQSQVSSLFLNTGVFVILLLGAAVVFLVIVIPSVLSLARQIFNPSLVKSSWNSLNIILVLFAIICGFLGRRDDEDQVSATNTTRKREADQPAGSSPRQWYDYQGQVAYNSFGNADTIRKVIRRNSSSYPDLRKESQWVIRENNMWRSYDDIDVLNPQVLRSESRISYHGTSREVDDDEDDAKTIEVDVGESQVSSPSTPPPPPPSPSPPPPPPPLPPPQPAARKTIYGRSKIAVDEDEVIAKKIEIEAFIGNQSKDLPPSNQRSVPCPPPLVHQPTTPPSPPAYILPPPSPSSYFWPPPSPTSYMWPPPSPPPPPPPPPPPRLRMQSSATDRKKTKRTYETIGRQSKWESSTKRESIPRVQVPPPSPPPPPPPPPPRRQSRTVASQYEKEKDNIGEKKRGSVTKDFLTSFYHQRKKKKKQKRRSYENLDEFTEPPMVSIHRSKSTPEFPPPSPPPPPPPPPHPHSVFHNLFSSKKGKSKKKIHSVPTAAPPTPPPPPPRPSSSKLTSSAPRRAAPPPAKSVSFSSTVEHVGNGSESPLLPIPPPPPPPPFKMPSWKFIGQGDYVKLESNSNSPRSGYSASEEDEASPSIKKTSNSTPSQFCPSPDVNIKADDFITRFREKLHLENFNSTKQKQGNAPSPLGPEARLTRTWST